ncbi:conserved hypothetical protein [Mesorhizobium plurifarium]|uniref:Uncharacterized protein n=1 Tax=Mesorhizobium plurifarium TaxID=69974 RepID=A0A090DYF1_MESPL|nr:conserved hypothetical protein [Mesorhizobium plurifarium]
MKFDAKTHAVSQQELAPMLGITTRRIRQIVAEGWFSANDDGKYVLRDAIAGYRAMMKAAAERRHNPTSDRLNTAKAEMVEARIRKFDADHIAMTEALQSFDEVSGDFLAMLKGLPPLITSDPRERERIDAIVDGDCQRLSEKWAVLREELRTGKPAKHRALELED